MTTVRRGSPRTRTSCRLHAVTRLSKGSISLGLICASDLPRSPAAGCRRWPLPPHAAQPHLLLLDDPRSSASRRGAAGRAPSRGHRRHHRLAEPASSAALPATRVVYLEDGALVRDDHPDAFALWAAGQRRELLPPVTRLFAKTMNGGGPLGGRLTKTGKDARRLLDQTAVCEDALLGFASRLRPTKARRADPPQATRSCASEGSRRATTPTSPCSRASTSSCAAARWSR
jgi:hypothetical protein